MLLRLIFFHLLGAWLLLSFFPGELRANKSNEAVKKEKVCGRPLARWVIITCGKIRHKRMSMLQQEQEPKLVLPYPSNDAENGQLDPEEGQIHQLTQGSDLLKNVHSLAADTEDSMIGSEESKETAEKNKNEIKAIRASEQHDFMLGTYLRKKREGPFKIPEIMKTCCEEGCTEKDFAWLC